MPRPIVNLADVTLKDNGNGKGSPARVGPRWPDNWLALRTSWRLRCQDEEILMVNIRLLLAASFAGSADQAIANWWVAAVDPAAGKSRWSIRPAVPCAPTR